MLAVHCAWRAHGEPEVSILCACQTQDELNDAERRLIDEHKTMSPNGYNVSIGGDTAPSKMPSVAAKIAEKATGRKASAQTKALMSQAMQAMWSSPEYQARVSEQIRAAYQKPEVRARHVAALTAAWRKKVADGWVMSPEHRAKLSAREFSEETRQRMSEAAKKRIRQPASEETRRKMAEAAKLKHASMTPEERAERGRKISEGRLAALRQEVAVTGLEGSGPRFLEH
jgi:hypothetical protein